MKINFYLRDKSVTFDTPIEFVIQFSFTEITEQGKKIYKKIKRSTGLSIKPRFWNEKNQLARESFGDYQAINLRLAEITSFLNIVEKEFHEKNNVLTIELLKEKLDIFFKGDKNKPIKYDLLSFAQYIVDNKEQKQHKRILNQSLRVLKEFSQATNYRIDFDTINIDFYDLFVTYLNKREYAKNTKAKHISNIKYFMNEAFQRKLHTNLDFKSSKFKAQKERVENIYLTVFEIETLFNLDLSLNPRLEKVRDLFLVGCYTGLRFSDFIQINSSNINGNILSIKTQKTGKYVKIPLRPEVKIILNKYNDSAPKAISNQRMNDYLKEIAKKAGLIETILKYKSKGNKTSKEIKYKYELVCTHTARRSFATNCYKANIPAKQIMLITGHTTESEFFKYIQINETENAELLLNNEYFMPKMKVV
jgi:integrase